MPNYRRHWQLGQLHFQTHVTYERIPLLVDNFDILWGAIDRYRASANFKIIAYAVLPDHFHWVVDFGESDPSTVVKQVKLSFSSQLRWRLNRQSGRIWQNRFWNHVIMSQVDLNRHIDYIHYNPAKHNETVDPFNYPYSSLADYYRQGYYSRDWCVVEGVNSKGLFGE